jgi:D-alanyl-D-alanine carboxypeptidase/D-alanyl-D-alanine-endopeptidase (penicillin-binding protein 4)
VRKLFSPVVLFLLLVLVLLDRQPVFADCRSFSSLISNGSYAVADSNGQIVSSCNENTSFIPASIIKIPLALAAFDILGPDFRFITEFYIDPQDDLYIKGYGDPFLVSEEIELILDRLVERGVGVINSIFIDNSTADLHGQVPGRGKSDNPYDVPVSSVAVNFNTVNIQVHSNGTVESAEPQTPTLPIMWELGKSLNPGEYRINVCQDGCSTEKQSARYTAELFRALQGKKGLPGNGSLEIRVVPADASLVYAHSNTRDLEEVVFSFLKYSNNFIANQVFLSCGVRQFGRPATWEKARKAVGGSLVRLLGKNTASQVYMEEGSGLSRKNRITANAMLIVLAQFSPSANLMQEKKNASMKSGTLDGVYNYAGYLADGKPFVILLNQEKNTRDKIFERFDNLSYK